MRYRDVPIIVTPSDLRSSRVPEGIVAAVLSGKARLVGFDSQGDAQRLVEARGATRARRPIARS